MERRRHQRISCILAVTLDGMQKEYLDPPELARVLDLSRGGLSIHSAECFSVGTRLQLSLQTGDRRIGPFEVHVRHSTRQANGTWIMGGEFASELREEVIRFILTVE